MSGVVRGDRPPRPGEDFAGVAERLAGFAAMTLGWTPEVFWSSTPAEIGCVAAALAGNVSPALAREDVAALMERFPDG